MVYALLVDRIEGEVRAVQTAAHLSAVFGGKPQILSLTERLEAFDRELMAEPEHEDPLDVDLRSALGLRGNRG